MNIFESYLLFRFRALIHVISDRDSSLSSLSPVLHPAERRNLSSVPWGLFFHRTCWIRCLTSTGHFRCLSWMTVPRPTSKVEPRHSSEEANFHRSYPWSYSFSHSRRHRNINQLVKWQCLHHLWTTHLHSSTWGRNWFPTRSGHSTLF